MLDWLVDGDGGRCHVYRTDSAPARPLLHKRLVHHWRCARGDNRRQNGEASAGASRGSTNPKGTTRTASGSLRAQELARRTNGEQFAFRNSGIALRGAPEVHASRKKDNLNTCPFRTETCTLSTPCHKCRDVAITVAHTQVRFDSHGRRRGAYTKERPVRYQTRHGGYWQNKAA
jgi:hypothetical protein